ncbi:MAG: hypothetical protein R6U32_06270 [Candidatus Woesearchaeota archaeon]
MVRFIRKRGFLLLFILLAFPLLSVSSSAEKFNISMSDVNTKEDIKDLFLVIEHEGVWRISMRLPEISPSISLKEGVMS